MALLNWYSCTLFVFDFFPPQYAIEMHIKVSKQTMKSPSWQLTTLKAIFINIFSNKVINLLLKRQKLCFISKIRERSPVITPKSIKVMERYYLRF